MTQSWSASMRNKSSWSDKFLAYFKLIVTLPDQVYCQSAKTIWVFWPISCILPEEMRLTWPYCVPVLVSFHLSTQRWLRCVFLEKEMGGRELCPFWHEWSLCDRRWPSMYYIWIITYKVGCNFQLLLVWGLSLQMGIVLLVNRLCLVAMKLH